ncbi:MAG: universal stress protein [Cyclobacteriaceae bacterium]
MKPIHNILVPVDFTENSVSLLKHAIQVAKPFNAKILIFHTYARPVLQKSLEGRFDYSIVKSLERYKMWKAERQINTRFKHLVKLVPELKTIKHDFIKNVGTIVKQVVKAAAEHKADIILMGTGGATGFDEFWGSKASQISMQTKIPVLIMPFKSSILKPGKIAFAYDFNKIKDLAELDIIKLFSLVYEAEVHVLNINESSTVPTSKQQAEIDRLREYFKDHDHSVHIKVHKDIEQGISEYIKQNEISILVVLHRSRSFFGNLFHDSLTEKFAYHSSIPVLALEG